MGAVVNEFLLYKHLCELESIASQYTLGRSFCSEIRKTAEEISTQKYTVAVVGEFRRGKSSLINALIGADILPTDILPTTAAVSRLVYGTNQHIVVYFRDGRKEEKSLAELVDFATKIEKQREETALSVREIVVSYPSLLCKNHIEILDTPGLNDNESMDEVTLSVIDKVDAAMMVISGRAPLSLTEQNLILDLISQSGIRHIVFVVTFLDCARSEKEKERLLEFIGNRLKNEVLPAAAERFADNPDKLEKAYSILKKPKLFGASSIQAMKGFTTDDEDLVEESRLPQLKENLLAILTAAQTADLPVKTENILKYVEDQLPLWVGNEAQLIEKLQGEIVEQKGNIEKSTNHLISYFKNMDSSLMRYGLYPDKGLCDEKTERMMLRCFITELSSITTDKYSHEDILAAILRAANQAQNLALEVEKTLEERIRSEMEQVENSYYLVRRNSSKSFSIENTFLNRELPFPGFNLDRGRLLPRGDLKGVNVITFIREGIHAAMDEYGRKINRFIGSWRVTLMRMNRTDKERWTLEYMERKKILDEKKAALQWNYENHVQKVKEIRTSLKEGKK